MIPLKIIVVDTLSDIALASDGDDAALRENHVEGPACTH